jgi:two-component system phosphate regulon sensor histidine kinase PhoR
MIGGGGLGILASALFFRGKARRRLKHISALLGRLSIDQLEYGIDTTEIERDSELTEILEALKHVSGEVRAVILHISTERNTISALLENMSDGIISTDADGQVTLINEAARRLLAISNSMNVEGRSFMQVARDHELNTLLKNTLEDGKERIQVLEVGPRRPQLQVKTARIDEELVGEKNSSGLVVLQDLSELARLERIRRDFVANISHELRTPLASVKLMVETLDSIIVDDPDAAHDFLRRIENEVDGLTQLVRELLELSRIESGQIKLNLRAVDLRVLAENTVERMQQQAARRGLKLINLSLPCEDDFPLALADPDRLTQVIINLTHNAIKFTPVSGEITLNIDRFNENKLVASVSDTGVGIPPDDLTRVFERFYKVDKARTGNEAGTGLGLAISKHIVQAHGGDIWAESKFGSGSTFFFTIPIYNHS